MLKGRHGKGYTLVSGGTDNHLCLVDLRDRGLNGAKVEKVMELVNIALNKNTVPGDVSAMNPGGIRMGSPPLTTRGLLESDFKQVAEFVMRGIEIADQVQSKGPNGTMKMNEFREALATEKLANGDWPLLVELKKEVVDFARSFPAVGFNEQQMKYKL